MSNTVQNTREARRFGPMICGRPSSGWAGISEMSAWMTPQAPLDATTFITRREPLVVDLGAVRSAFGGESTSARLTAKPVDRGAPVEPVDLIETEGARAHWVIGAATGWAQSGTARSSRSLRETANWSARAAASVRVDRLATIQTSLGFPLQTLARVLGISRPNLYKWLDASRNISLQAETRGRLAAIEKIAALWRRRTNMPLSLVMNDPLSTGKTALELLTNHDLDEEVVADAFDELVEKVSGRPRTRSERRAEAGFKRRKSHRALPREE